MSQMVHSMHVVGDEQVPRFGSFKMDVVGLSRLLLFGNSYPKLLLLLEINLCPVVS